MVAKISVTSSVEHSKIVPTMVSVRPNATDHLSVVLEVKLKDASSLLKTADVLVAWTPSKNTELLDMFHSRRYKVETPPTDNTFSIVVEFEPQPNGTAPNSTLSLQTSSMKPLWHRVTYFYVRLLDRIHQHVSLHQALQNGTQGGQHLVSATNTYMCSIVTGMCLATTTLKHTNF